MYQSQTPFRSQIPNLFLVRTIVQGHNMATIEGSLTLPCWQDFVIPDREGIKRRDGSQIYLHIMGEVAGKPMVTQEQVAAYAYVLEHQVAIQQSLLDTLLLDYAEWRDDYGTDDEAAMPEVDNTAQFKPLIQLIRIHLLQTHHAGIAYIGYEFECTWDDEHRLGFLAHQDRMAASGHADVSFTEWVAEGDLRKRSVVYIPSSSAVERKPWWRFW